jgi:hypothetical protein
MRITAGILMIIGGFIGGSLWFSFVGNVVSYFTGSLAPLSSSEAVNIAVVLGGVIPVIGFLPMFLAVIGGIYAFKRKHWRWALAGAICSLLFPFFGIPAIIFLIKSKGEFD